MVLGTEQTVPCIQYIYLYVYRTFTHTVFISANGQLDPIAQHHEFTVKIQEDWDCCSAGQVGVLW